MNTMTETSEKVIQVRGLVKRFGVGCGVCLNDRSALEKNYCTECGTVYALDDIGFDLHEKEILGIVGESGSGKSTLMRCLYFDQDPDKGTLELPSTEYSNRNLFSASRQMTALHPTIFPAGMNSR